MDNLWCWQDLKYWHSIVSPLLILFSDMIYVLIDRRVDDKLWAAIRDSAGRRA
jgi:hypothetical protein